MEYFTVQATWDYIDGNVQEMINEGWKPQGGVAVWVRDDGEPVYTQALTRSTQIEMSSISAPITTAESIKRAVVAGITETQERNK